MAEITHTQQEPAYISLPQGKGQDTFLFTNKKSCFQTRVTSLPLLLIKVSNFITQWRYLTLKTDKPKTTFNIKEH